MSKTMKTILSIVIGFCGLLLLVAVALVFVDVDIYRPRLEAAATKTLGMNVRVEGRMAIDPFKGLHLSLRNVHVGNPGAEIASVDEVRLGMDLLPLLRKEIRIETIVLKKPRVSISRDRDGTFNFKNPETSGKGDFSPLRKADLSISEGTLLYADQQSGEGFEARDCSLSVHPLEGFRGVNFAGLRDLSLTAELACGEIRKDALSVLDLKTSVTGRNGVFDVRPVRMRVFGGQGEGSIHADFSGADPLYSVGFSLPQFHIEEFFKTLSPQKFAEGRMDFSMNLSMQGKSVKEVKQTMEGQVSLRGDNILIHGHDLDEMFARFDSSQNFNLVDLGAFFFAGPLGLAVTKGYDFTSLLQGSGGSSEIRTLVSEWKVERGIARARDVAMATSKNRLALQGELDFVHEEFKEVTVALIDAQGCSEVQQQVRGTFQKPVVEKPSMLRSLSGPVLELLKKGRDLFPGGECEAFYTGSVEPPG